MSKRETTDLNRLPRYTGNHFEQSAGLRSAPDSAKGALKTLSTGKRFWCSQCQALRTVTAVSHNILQLPNSVTYQTILDCSHDRQIVVNVRNPKEKAGYTVPVMLTGSEGIL